MRIIKLMLLIALLLTVCAACNGEADKAQDSNDDDDDDNGDDDDDTVPPDEEPQLLASDFNFGPAQCKCPPDEKDDRTPVRVATFNAEGFSQITVQELEDDLDDYDPDIVCIQEVPTAILAEELSSRFGMVHLYSGEATGIVLLSKNVLTPVEVLTLDSGNAAIKARSTFGDHQLTIYALKLGSGAPGDHDANELLASLEAETAEDIIVVGGFGGAEIYTTQFDIIQPILADGFASLGIYPSRLHTIPSTGWFGADGPHLSDTVLFKRSSGICAADGGVITQRPAGSGHKPAWIELSLPVAQQPPAPQPMGVLTIFGPRRIEVLFDDILDPSTANGIRITYSDMLWIAPESLSLVGDGSRLRMDLPEDLQIGTHYTINPGNLKGVNGEDVFQGTSLQFTYLENLLSNPEAEQGLAGWSVEGDAREETGRKGLTPYSRDKFFAGSQTEPVSTMSQTLSLDLHAPTIDEGRGMLTFGAVTATSWSLHGTSTLPSSRDEAEILIEVHNSEGILMLAHSTGKWYPTAWHPVVGRIELPLGSRRVTMRLYMYQNSGAGDGNDAAFDCLFLGFGAAVNSLPRISPNLLSNPLWQLGEDGSDSWDTYLSEIEDTLPNGGGADDIASYGGPRLAVLGSEMGSGTIEQTVDLQSWAEDIDSREVCLEWSGYGRSWNGEADLFPSLDIYDGDGHPVANMDADKIYSTDWEKFEMILEVAPGVRQFRYKAEGYLADDGQAYLSMPVLHLRHTNTPGLCQLPEE